MADASMPQLRIMVADTDGSVRDRMLLSLPYRVGAAMSDRAEEVAAEIVETVLCLVEQAIGRPLRFPAGFVNLKDPTGVITPVHERMAETIRPMLRAYAEETMSHWRREADAGAMMFAAVHRGLGLVQDRKGGISAQDVLDYFALAVAEARREGWSAGIEAMRAAAVEELKLQSCRCGKRIRALPEPAIPIREEGER